MIYYLSTSFNNQLNLNELIEGETYIKDEENDDWFIIEDVPLNGIFDYKLIIQIEIFDKIFLKYYNFCVKKIKIIKLLSKDELIKECKDYYNVLSGEYWCKNGILHRDHDLPALIDIFGNQYWYQNGMLHRDNDQPAIIDINGEQRWYQNGKLHRDNDSAAIINNYGCKSWYQNGNCSRDNDLPSYIDTCCNYQWYLNSYKSSINCIFYRNNDLPDIISSTYGFAVF